VVRQAVLEGEGRGVPAAHGAQQDMAVDRVGPVLRQTNDRWGGERIKCPSEVTVGGDI